MSSAAFWTGNKALLKSLVVVKRKLRHIGLKSTETALTIFEWCPGCGLYLHVLIDNLGSSFHFTFAAKVHLSFFFFLTMSESQNVFTIESVRNSRLEILCCYFPVRAPSCPSTSLQRASTAKKVLSNSFPFLHSPKVNLLTSMCHFLADRPLHEIIVSMSNTQSLFTNFILAVR